MKRLLSLSYICILSACMAHASDATSAHVQFDKNSLCIESAILGNAHYSKISTEGLFSGGESGAPMLPVKIIHFSVPYNSEKFNIETRVTGQSRHELPHLPFPNQEPGSTDGRGESITHANPALYTRSTPAPIAEIVGESYSAGINKTVAVAIHPVQYDAMNNAVTFAYDMDIALSWSIQDDVSQLTPRPVFPADMSIAEESAEELKRKVVNPAEVEGNIAKQSPQKVRRKLPFIGDGPYEYIIVTTRNFKRAFERLAAYRKSAGYTANVVCIEDILSHSQFADGDVVSDLNDDAGKLRSFLSYAYSNFATRHVLLGGQLPIRYGITKPSSIGGKTRTPSDLYFGELNNSWRPKGDFQLGPSYIPFYLGSSDIITDYCCELNIGRLACQSVDDVNNFIDKLLLYEMNPGLGDTSYLRKAYAAVNNDFKRDFDQFAKEKLKELYDVTIVYQNYNYPKGTDIINHLNNQNFGYVDFQGHGTPESVSMTQNNGNNSFSIYGIQALSDELSFSQLEDEGEHALDNLKNKAYPHWTYSTACTAMPFDTQEYDSGTYEQLSKNFGESYVMGKDYGGIAFLGYTRNSIISHANSMYSYFLEHLKADDIHPPLLGMAETKSKTIDIYAGSRPIELNHHTKLAHNLLGDPLTRPWVKVPKKIECLSRNNSHTLANIPEDGCIITTRNLNNETITSNCIAGKTSHTIDTIPPNVAMSVYGRSILPMFMPLTLQNIKFNKSRHYIFAGDVYCGEYSTRPISHEGMAIIEDGAHVTIESTGNVKLYDGTTIKPGGKLTIICKGEVSIDRIKLPRGASLEIHSTSLIIKSGSMTIESGSIFRHDNKIPLYLTK